MCVTAVIAGAALLASAVGTYSSIKSSNANAKYQNWQAKEQQKQIRENQQLSTIASMEQENARARDFNRSWSASMSAIAASGMAEHISFFQGIGPDAMNTLSDDVRAARLNLTTDIDRGNRQIGVVKYGAQVAGFNAKMSNVGAMANFVQDAMSAASVYMKAKVPAAPKAGG